MSELLRLNLGCGEKFIPGFVNVDNFETPDLKWDLEQFPWPWEDNSVCEIKMIHVLEHLGESTSVFIKILQELYRISTPGARIEIAVPHPRHDDFLNDPTHVRPITMETMALFSQKNNRETIRLGASNTPLGIYNNIDFEMVDGSLNLDPRWNHRMAAQRLTNEQIEEAILSQNNVVKEIIMIFEVIKENSM